MHSPVVFLPSLTNGTPNSSDLLCASSTYGRSYGCFVFTFCPSCLHCCCCLEIYIAVCPVNGLLCLIAKKLCQKNPNVNLLEMKR